MPKTVVVERFVAQGFKTCTDFAQRSSFLRWQGRCPRWSERRWMEAPSLESTPGAPWRTPLHVSVCTRRVGERPAAPGALSTGRSAQVT